MQSLTSRGLSDTERSLLAAYIVTEPSHVAALDASAADDVSVSVTTALATASATTSCAGSVRQLHQLIWTLLDVTLRRNHADEPLLLTHVRSDYDALLTATHEIRRILEWFRKRYTFMRLPPLFCETFDIPKNVS